MNAALRQSDIASWRGGRAIFEWFDGQTDFHDAELHDYNLNVGGDGNITIRHWRVTGELDDKGFYRRDREAQITLFLTDIRSVDLRDEKSKQTVIFHLVLERVAKGVELSWDSSVGVSGQILARDVHFELTPIGRQGE